jgi:hypothetical protein
MSGKVLIEKEIGAIPTETEIRAVDILVVNGFVEKHVLFLKPNRRKGARTPDIQIDDDLKWEIKSIEKNGKYTLDHAERAALRQADKLIFDLQKLRGVQIDKVIKRLERDFKMTNKWRKLAIITKDEKVLTCKK